MVIGTNIDVSRRQVTTQHASTDAMAQRLLCRVFWLRMWSRLQVGFFRVSSKFKPADPPSGNPAFPTWSAAKRAAEERRTWWENICDKYPHPPMSSPPLV